MNPETHQLMQDPAFQKRIVEIRNESPQPSWELVAKKVKDEFDYKISNNGLITTYRQAIARGITVEGKAQKHFEHLVDPLKESFGRMINRTEVISDAFDSLLEEIDKSDADPVQKASAKLKLVVQLEKLNKILESQMKFMLDEVDKIKVEQKKIIYDDSTIVRKINETLPIILKQHERDGKIVVVDKSILK